MRGFLNTFPSRILLFAEVMLPLLPRTFAADAPSAIDPQIYAKIFEINQPCWDKIADEINNAHSSHVVSLLDIGAGPGEPTTTILSKVPAVDRITCTDAQPTMIEKAKARTSKKLAPELAKKITFDVASAEDLSKFEENSFDVVIGVYVLMFVDVAKVLREVDRVLKPGGVAFFPVWTEMPFYEVTRSMVDRVWTKHGKEASAPSFPVNPMALSPTQWNTKGNFPDILLSSKADQLRLKTSEKITYDFPLGDLDALCAASRILTNGVVPKMAESLEKAEAAVHAGICSELQQELQEKYPEWKREAGKWIFGQGTATIYKVQKSRGEGKEEL